MSRLPRPARAGGSGGRHLLDLPRATGGAPTGGARLVHRLPPAPRLRGRWRRGLRPLPWREDDAGGAGRARACRLYELPRAARSGGRRGVVRFLPCERPCGARRSGDVRDVSLSARGTAGRRRVGVHELPCECRRLRHGRARRRRRVRGVPQAARVRGPGSAGALQDVPRARDVARGEQRGPSGLRVLSWSVRRARPGEGARVQYVPCQGASERPERTPAVRGLSRRARGRDGRGMLHLSRKRIRRSACVGPGRLRDLPPPPWSRWHRVAALVRELSRAFEPARAPYGRRSRGLRELSRRASRAAAGRPVDLHGELSRGSARSSASGRRVHRLPRVPAVGSDRGLADRAHRTFERIGFEPQRAAPQVVVPA
jgi:hypothetical protein